MQLLGFIYVADLATSNATCLQSQGHACLEKHNSCKYGFWNPWPFSISILYRVCMRSGLLDLLSET